MALIVLNDPYLAENGNYQRSPQHVGQLRFTTRPKKVVFVIASGGGSQVVNGQLFIDGEFYAEGMASSANNWWTFMIDVPDGHHVMQLKIPSTAFESIPYPFIMNVARTKFAVQKPWATTTAFERWFPSKPISVGAVQVEYNPNYKRPVFTLKARQFAPITKRLALTETYTDLIATNTGTNIMERFPVEDLDGNIWWEPQQKYFYSDVSITNGNTPPHPLIDGPFGVGTLGFVSDMHINNEGTGAYLIEALGSLRFVRYGTGDTITIAGKRVKPGQLPAPNNYRKNTVRGTSVENNALTAAERKHYDSKYEDVGTWGPGTGGHFREPWAVYVYPDHRQAGGHEFLVPNTRAANVLYVNHLTAHAAPPRDPLFAPNNYVMPAEVRPADVVVWHDKASLMSMGFSEQDAINCLTDVWGIDRREKDGRIYLSSFHSGYIWSANPDRTNPRIDHKPTIIITDTMLGVKERLAAPPAFEQNLAPGLRARYPGQIGKPQMISFDSEGNLIGGSRYFFNLWKLNPDTGEFKIIKELPVSGYSDKFHYDVFVRVDRKGVMGAVDDIFVSCWGWNTDFRYGKDGAELSAYHKYPIRQASYGTLTGPGEMSMAVGYNWPMDFNANHMVVQGTAGGSQIYRIFKREPIDPAVDRAKYQRGIQACHKGSSPPMALTHGVYMQNFLQKPDCREMGSWDDEKAKAYAVANGVPQVSADDWLYALRRLTYNVDYSNVPPPPPDHDHSHDQKIDFFQVTPAEWTIGATPTPELEWGTTDADKVFIDGDEVPDDGSMPLDMTTAGSYTFKLTTTGTSHTPVEASVTLTVKAKPQTEVEILKEQIAALEQALNAKAVEVQALKDEVEANEFAMSKLNESLETIKAEESREETLRVALEQKTALLETKIAKAKAELA
jgi:hypothetical protein